MLRPLLFSACCLVMGVGLAQSAETERPNLLIITVDDMSCDSVGAFGCRLPETTPNIDQFASLSMRFGHAHVQVGNCYPSRNVMLSGRYPHNTGVEGFYQVTEPKYPHLVDLVKQAGYFVAIRGKVSHSTPYQPYAWDADLTIIDGEKQDMKNAASYYRSTKRGIQLATEVNKPFCLNVNISDPHKPFYATAKNGQTAPDPNVPSRVFTADEVPIPGFLFDHPDVRRELAQYYSSVRRADDCFAEVMRALDESGQQDQTVVMFLSDHGMPLPFAKTALWHHSTHTPWIVRWPGVTQAGSLDSSHMISAVDMLPTLLDIIGVEHPAGIDGRSFAPLLKGETQSDRNMVYKVYNENSGGVRNPMRSVQSKQYGYLYNPWVDGKRFFKTATTGTLTYRTMQKLAEQDEPIAKRLEFFNHGVLEELYDYQADPDALNNLVGDPEYADVLAEYRQAMQHFMQETNDPLLEVFKQLDNATIRNQYVNQVQGESDARRAAKRKSAPKKQQNQKLFSWDLPSDAKLSEPFTVVIHHNLPKRLGEQSFHVTLKTSKGRRIERIVETAAGEGELEFQFVLSPELDTDNLHVAAFVGAEFQSNLLYRTAGPIALSR